MIFKILFIKTCDTAKDIVREKFTVVNSYFRKNPKM